MKTLLINGSPKKKRSVSGFFLDMESFFTGGERIKETLHNKTDHERILEKLKGMDNVVFCLPLYVDGVPSHVLYFMKDMEAYCREHDTHVNIYVISNGGFIEGRQNAWLMQVFENFCVRSGNTWCGGIGIGGGVIFYELLMAGAIRKGKVFGVKFTRAMMPSILFILVADIFFVIMSVFQGGIFKGWLAKKE